MEYLGASAVFGERSKSIPTSSNKSMIGHTLSAAGAVEAAITLLTLKHQRLPPTSMIGRGAAHRSCCSRLMSVAPGQVSTGSKVGASGTAMRSTSTSSGSAITTGPGRPLVAV